MVLDRRVAFKNLTNDSIEILPVSLNLRKIVLGGRGIKMYLLSKSYSSQLDPFSAELVKAGLGHLVITGRSSDPIDLFIKKNKKDDFDTSLNTAALCHQCREMKCLAGEDATKAQDKKAFIWDRIRAEPCPFHTLPVSGEKAYLCDLCGGTEIHNVSRSVPQKRSAWQHNPSHYPEVRAFDFPEDDR